MSYVKWLDVVKNARPLADPTIGDYGHVDFLLGANGVGPAYRDITKQSQDRTVTVTWTLFGWTVRGTIPAAKPQSGKAPQSVYNMCEKTDSLDSILQKLWQQEAVRKDSPHLTEAEHLAEEHFQDTHRRADNGRYIMKLPCLTQPPQLEESKPIALQRFHQNRRSLQRKDQWEPFCTIMDEYSHLQHLELVPPKDFHKQTYYLPSHGVSKQDSTTTKLRVLRPPQPVELPSMTHCCLAPFFSLLLLPF